MKSIGVFSDTDCYRVTIADNRIVNCATAGVEVKGERNFIGYNYFENCNEMAIALESPDTYMARRNTVIGNVCYHTGYGTGFGSIYLYSARRNAIVGNVIIESYNRGIELRAASDGNAIVGNMILSSQYHGIDLGYSDLNAIIGNEIDDSGKAASGTYSDILLDTSRYTIVIGNKCYWYPTDYVKYNIAEQGTSNNNIIANNYVRGASTQAILKVGANTRVKDNIGYATENSGTATFSGNGSTTTFNIPHGLASTPKMAVVTAGSNGAKGDFYVTYDATNIIVTYATAPPTGTNNVVLNWYAEV
jgi:parallel beta-helix repeat protein